MSLIYLAPLKGMTVPFSPTSIPGIQLWYDGSDASTMVPAPTPGSSVNDWKDKSGNGHDAGASGTLVNPTYQTSVLNGNSALEFAPAGANAQGLMFAQAEQILSTSSPFSIFLIMKFNSFNPSLNIFLTLAQDASGTGNIHPYMTAVSTTFGFFGSGASWASFTAPFSAGTTNFHKVNYAYNGSGSTTLANMSLTIDGTPLTLSTAASDVTDANTVGSYDANGAAVDSFKGYFAEIIVYRSTPSPSQMAQLNAYFLAKWGI